MPDIEIIGASQSTFVRTARIAAHELGLGYDLNRAPPHSPEVDALHPSGKIPVMRHGDVTLYESRAIIAYFEAIAGGKRVTHADPIAAAHEEAKVSAMTTSLLASLVRDYLLAYVFPGTEDGSPDRARIDAALPEVERAISILASWVEESDFMSGAAFGLADAYAVPALAYVKDLPEAGAMIAERPKLKAYIDRIESRPSVAETVPDPIPR